MKNDGLSKVAVQVEQHSNTRKKWTRKKKRPLKYRKKTYGLVVHTTGSGITSRALQKNKDVFEMCLDRYLKTGGATYLNGYDGSLVQMANDFQMAYGASVKDQLKQHPWDAGLDPMTSSAWEDRWEHLEDVEGPLDLFPTKYANACYVHVEMPPIRAYNKEGLPKNLADSMRAGIWFTKVQHDNIVKLSIDLADRNSWPDGWWKTGRLVGHEDVSPCTREGKGGGWDPGALRANPRFDWNYVYEEIEAVYAARARSEESLEEAERDVKEHKSGDPYQRLIVAFVNFVSGLFERKK